MTTTTRRADKALQIVFASLTALFFILVIGDLTRVIVVRILGGYVGIFCGSSAVYLTIAEILNKTYGRTILPIGNNAQAHA